jgi:hypothetical protein
VTCNLSFIDIVAIGVNGPTNFIVEKLVTFITILQSVNVHGERKKFEIMEIFFSLSFSKLTFIKIVVRTENEYFGEFRLDSSRILSFSYSVVADRLK